MSPSAISFLVWTLSMVLFMGVLVLIARRSRDVQSETEDIASKALPEIGEIAEKKHRQRFGRAPTNSPSSSESGKGSWYPEIKKKSVKHA